MVKPDDVTLVIVPVEPPSAGPDRAFDPPLPLAPGNPWPAAAGADVDEDVGVDVADCAVAAHPVRPTAVTERTATVIHAFLLFSSERSPRVRAGSVGLLFMISLLLFRKSP
jgi:hypothetical protein